MENNQYFLENKQNRITQAAIVRLFLFIAVSFVAGFEISHRQCWKVFDFDV